jgi:hypothetical protein
VPLNHFGTPNEAFPERCDSKSGNRQTAILISSSAANDSFCMKKKPSPTGAAAYARMSAKHQSIGDQMKAIRKYAKRRGLEIENEYSDGAKQPTER